jgi:hypothetical protein
MAKFLFVYRNQPMGRVPSPEEMQAELKSWGEWIGKFMATQEVVDGGDGLHETGKVVKAGGVVSDGPFLEAKEILGGYSIIQAASYDRAVQIAQECPVVLHGGSIEIRELAGYN